MSAFPDEIREGAKWSKRSKAHAGEG